MTDQPQKWIFVAPETFGDWTCGEWSTEGDGALLHSDVQVLYALAKDMIPRAEADAMVAAVYRDVTSVLYEAAEDWDEEGTTIEGDAIRAEALEINKRTPDNARAAFERAVQEAVEKDRALDERAVTEMRDDAVREAVEAERLEFEKVIYCLRGLDYEQTKRAIAAIRAPQEPSE